MRVRRAFAFVDLCGFTALTDAHGDETAVAHLAAFRSIVREVCSRRGVRVAKWLGDGAMLVGVETTPLVAAVVELEARVSGSPLALRGGLTVGDVILFEGDDYIGHAVNLAARLSDLAEPHEILATADVAAAAPPWATCVAAGERAIRGLGRPVPLVHITACRHDGDRVTDPVCRMELPADAVVATRVGADGATVSFCSESCAETWEGRAAPPADRGLLA